MQQVQAYNTNSVRFRRMYVSTRAFQYHVLNNQLIKPAHRTDEIILVAPERRFHLTYVHA